MGTLSTLALHSALTAQLDEKLTAAHRRTVDGPVRVGGIAVAPDQAADELPAPPGSTFRPGQDAGTVNVQVPDGADPADLTALQA